MHVKMKVLVATSACFASIFTALPGMPYEYSIRHAFCTDYARQRSRFLSSSFYYDLQIAYNECMANADILIFKYEQKNREYAILEQKRQAQWQQERLQRETDRKILEAAELQRLRNLQNNIENLFR